MGARSRCRGDREEDWENAGTALLRAAGAFERGAEIRSPRSLAARREREWTREMDGFVGSASRPGEAWRELEWIARAVSLTDAEMRVVGLVRAEERSLREVARMLRMTLYEVRRKLEGAEAKCRRASRVDPDSVVTPRALFWEEIRQKEAAVYRRPSRRRQ